MEWMKQVLDNGGKLEMKKDKRIKAKLDSIDMKLKENLQENIEEERLREQKTLELSRQYFIG
ncbi:MAG: hypothetical protein JRC93_09970 [Deltaproteobacteria bacterium]|nr:hypothetical protein [Deltaproteobacteria bacterium]